MVRITVPPGDGSVVIEGRLYQRQPVQQQQDHQRIAPLPTPQTTPYAHMPASRPQSRNSGSYQRLERVVSSIEHADKHNLRVNPHMQHARPQAEYHYHNAQRAISGTMNDFASPRDGQSAQQQLWTQEQSRSEFVNASVAPIQYVPHPQQQSSVPFESPGRSRALTNYARDYPSAHGGSRQPQQVIYVDAARGTPQPVHGAPAAIQQLPRAGGAHGQMQPLDARYAIASFEHVVPGSAPQFYHSR